MVMALIFVTLFSALSVALLSMSSGNVRMASNHHHANMALSAALSGLECARYVAATTPTIRTGLNFVTDSEADQVWGSLCDRLAAVRFGSLSVGSAGRFTDGQGAGDEIETADIPYAGGATSFRIRFYRYDADPRDIYIHCRGQDDNLSRTVQMAMRVTKDSEVLRYAIAGRGRMWLTGDTTIRGDIYTAWDRTDISPFNMTSDAVVEGSINTSMAWQDIMEADRFELQSYEHDGSGRLLLDDDKAVTGGGSLVHESGGYIYDEDGRVIDIFDLNFEVVEGEYNRVVDSYGNPVEGYIQQDGHWVAIGEVTYGNPVEAFNADDTRYYRSGDELQGQYETVNYSQPDQQHISGLSIGDYYDSSGRSQTELIYKNSIPSGYVSGTASVIRNGTLSRSGVRTRTEYFPHAAGDYSRAAGSGSLRVTRYIYENKTISNVVVNSNTNALFRNCTFNDVLYIDCSKSTSSYYNNIRFEDCTFNGVIVTNAPDELSWQRNALYFTGSANFNNVSSHDEFTILAPHFNVNLGDANNGEVQSDENVLKGAIVGGIVDVRGNATIEGTIISMCDTTGWSSGFVTNIGATLDDGGSETVMIEDIGTIEITPRPDELLPSGITTPVKLKTDAGSYTEVM